MVKRTGPTNYQLQQLLLELEVTAMKSKFWQRIVEDLKRPTRQRRVVNIYTIEKCAQKGETIIVPGKVLSVGTLSKNITIAALQFSADAQRKIVDAKGKIMTIPELLQQNPEGKNVRILG